MQSEHEEETTSVANSGGTGSIGHVCLTLKVVLLSRSCEEKSSRERAAQDDP